MATLQNIRNRAGILVAIVIGLALVAFILGDALQQGNSIFQKSQNKIAEINGEDIQYMDFQKKVEEYGDIVRLNSGQTQLDENTWVQAREQTWQTFQRDILMGEVYEDLGIAVSAEELYDLVQGNNIHPIIRQIFADQTTGQVNRQAIISFLKNLETGVAADQRAYWYYLEKQIADDRVLSKYNNLIKQGLYVTTEEAQNSINNNSKQVSFDYISLPFSSVADSTLEISNRELKKYYNEHADEYKEEKTRRIEYVIFPVTPSEQDNLDAKTWIEDIKGDFASAENNIQFTNTNSDESFVDNWLTQEGLSTDVANWVFEENADTNQVYGPYFEDGAYKLAKVHAIGMLPKDSVKARHILLTINSQAEVLSKQALADSLKTEIENGADFAALAREYSTDSGSAINGGDLGWFGKGAMVKPFEDAAFGNKKGEVSIAISQFGIHIIQTTQRSKLHKHVKIAYVIREVNASDVTYQKAYGEASKFASENRTQEDFEMSVTANGLGKRVATVREFDRDIIGLTGARAIVRAAFTAEVGDVLADFRKSSIFEIGDNFVIGVLMEATEEGNAPFENVKERVKLAVAKEKKGQQLLEKINAAMGSNDFAVIAQELGAEIKTAENINFNSFSIPEVGVEPAVVGTTSIMDVEQISKPIKGNNAVFLVKVTGVTEGAETDLAQEQQNLTQSLGYRAGFQSYEAIKNAAEIEDNRSKFY